MVLPLEVPLSMRRRDSEPSTSRSGYAARSAPAHAGGGPSLTMYDHIHSL